MGAVFGKYVICANPECDCPEYFSCEGRTRPRRSRWRRSSRNQQNGSFENEGRDHPAAATRLNPACGIEGCIFKHGLPP